MLIRKRVPVLIGRLLDVRGFVFGLLAMLRLGVCCKGARASRIYVNLILDFEGFGTLTRSFMVLAPTELMMWMASCKMKTVRRRDGIMAVWLLDYTDEAVVVGCEDQIAMFVRSMEPAGGGGSQNEMTSALACGCSPAKLVAQPDPELLSIRLG